MTLCTHLPKGSLFSISLFFSALAALPAAAPAENDAKSFAQHADFFHLYFEEPTDIKASYLYSPGNDSSSSDAEYELQAAGAILEMPLPISRDFYLRMGAELEQRSYTFEGRDWRRLGLDSDDLYRIVLAPGAGWFLTDNLLLTGRALLGAYSNLDGGVKEDDFQTLGDALLVYRINPQAQVLGGAAFTNAYEDYDVLPLAGIRLLGEDGRLHISVTFPLSAYVSYQLIDSISAYGVAAAAGDEYELRMDRADYTAAIRERRVGGGFSFWLGSHLNVLLEAGAIVDSQIDISGGRRSRSTDDDFNPAPYLAGRIGFAL